MDDWLSHYYFDTHQLRARNAAVEAVASAPAGERLVILTDWAEKLGLVPPSSSTGGTYEQLGLLMNVCIYKDARGVRVETHAVLADSEVNDVPHTHTGLQKIVAHYANRSKQQKVKLTSISIWSDGIHIIILINPQLTLMTLYNLYITGIPIAPFYLPTSLITIIITTYRWTETFQVCRECLLLCAPPRLCESAQRQRGAGDDLEFHVCLSREGAV